MGIAFCIGGGILIGFPALWGRGLLKSTKQDCCDDHQGQIFHSDSSTLISIVPAGSKKSSHLIGSVPSDVVTITNEVRFTKNVLIRNHAPSVKPDAPISSLDTVNLIVGPETIDSGTHKGILLRTQKAVLQSFVGSLWKMGFFRQGDGKNGGSRRKLYFSGRGAPCIEKKWTNCKHQIPSRFFCPALLVGSLSNPRGEIRPQFSFGSVISAHYGLAHQHGLPSNEEKREKDSQSSNSLRPCEQSAPEWRLLGGLCGFAGLGCLVMGDALSWRVCACSGLLCVTAWICIAGHTNDCDESYSEHDNWPVFPHRDEIVPQKYLTSNNYWGTVIDMANVLNTDKQIAIIGALAEGSSIRSIERITGVHRETIMRLGVKIGNGCAAVMDSTMRNLPCNRLEMDEIWGFVGKKDKNVRVGEDAVGSVWTFCAIDAETKLVSAFKVGDRSITNAKAFVHDVANRMAHRVQISTDGLNAYVSAIESAFGGEVDYAQIIKTYGHEEATNNRRYSAPDFVSSEKIIHVGNPDVGLISTSYVERLNATTRLHMRRLTRLTLAFSKKRENFEAAVALHFAHYNFVKRHSTIRCTPAMSGRSD
jgi:IS1 family transposase